MPDIDLSEMSGVLDLGRLSTGVEAPPSSRVPGKDLGSWFYDTMTTRPAALDEMWSIRPSQESIFNLATNIAGPRAGRPPAISLQERARSLREAFQRSETPHTQQGMTPQEVAESIRRGGMPRPDQRFLEEQLQYHPPGQPLDPGIPPGQLVRGRSTHPDQDVYFFNNQQGETKGRWSVSRQGAQGDDLWVNIVRNVIPGKDFAAGENTMGRKAALSMIRQLFERYPDVKRIGGERVGGAKPGRIWWINRDQAVTDAMLIAVFGPMLGYTLTPVDHDPFAHAD